MERWLREEVAAAYDEDLAYPDATVPADEIMARLRERRREHRDTPNAKTAAAIEEARRGGLVRHEMMEALMSDLGSKPI